MRGSMFFLGSEVYFTSEKIDQQKLKKKKNNKKTYTNKTKQHEYREAPVHAIYSVIIVFVPFWLIFNAMISCICGIHSSNMYIEILR